MIITEYYKTRSDGVVLNRTYSSNGCYITRGGIEYTEAIDPADLNREYIETDKEIEVQLIEITEDNQAEIAEKAMAYDILVGGN